MALRGFSLGVVIFGCFAVEAASAGSVDGAGQTEMPPSSRLETVMVYGLLPGGLGEQAQHAAMGIQQFSAADLARQSSYSIAQFLDRQAAGVYVNDAQNNPLQPDIRFRGYSASPLLGTSQGVVAYFNGVRMNEPFGDAINWDLLPDNSMANVALVSGPNPLFGQNALGGAIVIQGKTGFNSAAGVAGVGAGSDGAVNVSLEQGGHGEHWGGYLLLEHFEEDGWRDFSATEADNAYGALSYRREGSEADLFIHLGDSYLKGNGASPEALLASDRTAVFTHPDLTENRLAMVNLVWRHWLSETLQISGNLFHRHVKSDSFNGDGSDLEACPGPDEAFLCDDDDKEFAEDQFGNRVSSDFNAINNISRRDQDSWGSSFNLSWQVMWAGFQHHLDMGVDLLFGQADFVSRVEFAELTATRSTTRSGLYNAEGGNDMSADNDLLGFYLADSIELRPGLNLQLALRHNSAEISGKDHSGERPELTASHRYQRWNGGLGLSQQVDDQLQIYGGIYQSSRAPTPIELACSHPEAPCSLPNTFLADPPLKDVVSRSLELGLRFDAGNGLTWQAGVFNTLNRHDIHFQTTGGVASNQGFFTNIGDTRHRGLEASVDYRSPHWLLSVGYSYTEASFEDSFNSFSPNHPDAEEGVLPVAAGSQIPGVPRHNFKMNLDYLWNERLTTGVSMTSASGVYLRGDEANRDAKTDSFMIFNLGVDYRPTEAWLLRLSVRNLLDREYERFGLYGEADEVLDDLDTDSARFLGPAPPRQWLATLEYRW